MPHCLPGGSWDARDAHELVCPWPEDCSVQWGARGIVLGRLKARRTAFFEAFPAAPATFIRGEGASVAEAERAAFAQLERVLACGGHEFERRGYTNGAGFCRHCGLFKSKAFEPSTLCTVCAQPTYYTWGRDAQGLEHWYCEQHAALRPRDTQPSPLDRLLAEECGPTSDSDPPLPNQPPCACS